jgi:predicted Zn-dependent protease
VSGRSRDELLAVAAAALDHVGAADAEIVAVETDSQLTRFANNTIHQNVGESSLQLRARVIKDGRVGVAQVRGETEDAGERVAAAAEQTRVLAGTSDPPPLPRPDGTADTPVAFSPATKNATPEQRAEMAAVVVEAAERASLLAYGSVKTTTTRTAVVNSAGVRRFAESSESDLVTVMRGEDGGGYAARHAVGVDDVDPAAAAAEAVDTCVRNQSAGVLEPGAYEVVLAPYAVIDILDHLGWVGFNALAKLEHRSFMRPGERLMSELVTIRDDPRDPALFPYPFDDEGVSSRPVTLIDRGVCAGFVYDTPTAARDGVVSTGHSLPQPNTWGPYARHVVMDAGDQSVDELIGAVRRGLYVTRLWYVRDVHPLRTIITGMTREGTFLIEEGRVARPVRDLRFTQSIVDALADVRGVSADRHLALGEDASGVLAPWVHLGRVTFTS